MNKLFYFKATFLSVSAGLFTGIFIYGLFDVDLESRKALTNLLLKSLVVSVGTGLVLGVLNMFFKMAPFTKRRNQDGSRN